MTDHTPTADQLLIRTLIEERARHEERFAHLWRMTREERVGAMWRGELSDAECLAWARRAPREVPLIGHEFAFIIMRTPEWLGD